MDVAIFVTLLSLVAVSLVTFIDVNSNEMDAASICEDVFSMRFDASMVFDDEASGMYYMSELTAMGLSTGKGEEVENYLKKVLDDITEGKYNYYMMVKYGNNMLHLGHDFKDASSSCNTEINILGDRPLIVHFKIC